MYVYTEIVNGGTFHYKDLMIIPARYNAGFLMDR